MDDHPGLVWLDSIQIHVYINANERSLHHSQTGKGNCLYGNKQHSAAGFNSDWMRIWNKCKFTQLFCPVRVLAVLPGCVRVCV